MVRERGATPALARPHSQRFKSVCAPIHAGLGRKKSVKRTAPIAATPVPGLGRPHSARSTGEERRPARSLRVNHPDGPSPVLRPRKSSQTPRPRRTGAWIRKVHSGLPCAFAQAVGGGPARRKRAPSSGSGSHRRPPARCPSTRPNSPLEAVVWAMTVALQAQAAMKVEVEASVEAWGAWDREQPRGAARQRWAFSNPGRSGWRRRRPASASGGSPVPMKSVFGPERGRCVCLSSPAADSVRSPVAPFPFPSRCGRSGTAGGWRGAGCSAAPPGARRLGIRPRRDPGAAVPEDAVDPK